MAEEKGPRKFWEGTLLHKSPSRKDWHPLWVVLKGRKLFFFKDRENSAHSLVGEIQLDLTVEVKLSKKQHTVFEILQKLNKKDKRVQKFKCQSKAEREIWRAFIVGVAKGCAPSDLDWSAMLPGQRDDLLRFVRFLESGGIQTIGQSLDRVSNGSSSEGSSSFDTNDSTGGITVQKHLQPLQQLSRQTWYFDHIDRDKGEQILNLGQAYGNLLVRPSVTRKGNFVIQFKALTKWREYIFYNFLVEKSGHGYSLVINDTEIPKPVCEAGMNPKPTVFDILDFFVLHVTRFLSVADPKPMTTNDLNELGLWGEYGAHTNTLLRPDPGQAARQRRVRFERERISGIAEEIDDDLILSSSPSSSVEVPPPLPPANPSSAAARVDGKTKHLPRKFFPVDSDSDDDIGIIPPPPYNPAPPPPPAKLSNKPLPAPPVAPPTASKPTGPLSSSGVPPPPAPPPPPGPPPPMNDTNNNNQNGIGSGLGSALQNIRLKKVASTDHNEAIGELDLVISNGAGRPHPPQKEPVMDFQDELRKKLTKRLIYETPSQFRTG